MKNITMLTNVNSLKNSIKDFMLLKDYEFFTTLIKTNSSYHVVTITYNLYEDEFYISHPSYNFSFDEIKSYAVLTKE